MSLSAILFPTEALSETEQERLFTIFSDPLVRKYLRILGHNEVTSHVFIPALDTSSEKLAVAQAGLQGKLEILGTLLSIAKE